MRSAFGGLSVGNSFLRCAADRSAEKWDPDLRQDDIENKKKGGKEKRRVAYKGVQQDLKSWAVYKDGVRFLYSPQKKFFK